MSSLDFELDMQMNHLEIEWRQTYEDSVIARAEYQALAASPVGNAERLDRARERLARAEAKKARIKAKIERLEDSLLDQ
jgi:pyruvate kinase